MDSGRGGRGRARGRGGGRGRGGRGGWRGGGRSWGRGKKQEVSEPERTQDYQDPSLLVPTEATVSTGSVLLATPLLPPVVVRPQLIKAEAPEDNSEPWDPMEEMFSSFKNLMQPGEPSRLRAPRTEEFPCPFQKVPGEVCFKGSSCKYQHGKYTPEMLKGRAKLAGSALLSQETVEISETLAKKHIPASGYLTLAWIPTTLDPSEFYVIPWSGWKCLCKCSSAKNLRSRSEKGFIIRDEDDEGIGDGRQPRFDAETKHRGGLDILDVIMEGMKRYYQMPRLQNDGYAAGELVAVKMKTRNDWGVFRAVVMEDTDQLTEEAIGVVKVKLLDFGLEVEKSQAEVWCLPERFSFVGPLAYKCQLFGVNPILGKWGKKATKKFNEFVSGQLCLVEVKKTVYPDVNGLFESPPILLNVWPKVNGVFINVKDYFVEEGMGVEWNPFPLRPFAAHVLPMKEYEYALKEIETEEDRAALEETYAGVMEREQSRLDRYVERLKCRYGLDEEDI